MNTFFIFFFSMFVLSFFLNFSKKVSMLLILEGLMLSLVFFLGVFYSMGVFSSFLLLLLTIFMVLDSVFGMSLLILGCRESSTISSIFTNL